MDKNEVASVAYRCVSLSWVPRFGRGGRVSVKWRQKKVGSVTHRSFSMSGIPVHPHSEQMEGERALPSACMALKEDKGQN